MAWCRVADIQDIPRAWTILDGWLLGAAIALVVGLEMQRRGKPASARWIAAGIGVMTIPAWLAILSTMPDIVRTFCAQGNLNLVIPPGQTAPAQATYQLSGQYIGSILSQLAYILVGILLVWRGTDEGWRNPTLRHIAASVRGFVPMGRGEKTSFITGLALFPLLLAANLLLLWLTSGANLRTGDDSHVFDNITGLQVLLVALAAGVGEELVYRGVMLQGISHLVPGRWIGRIVGGLVQAIIFAYAHAGYANLQHLLFAFLFAVFAAVVVETLGIWAAITLHFLIDFTAFAASVAHPTLTLQYGEFAVAVGVLTAAFLRVRSGVRRVLAHA